MMNLYSLVLFLHVSGDIGIFIGIGLQLFSLMTARRAKHVEQVQPHLVNHPSDRVSVSSALLMIGRAIHGADCLEFTRTDRRRTG
jgi:hypothetical protein